MAAQEYQAPESVGRLQQRALIIGGVALLVSIFGAVRSPGDFYQSYLVSFLLILGLTVGSLGLVMLQHLTSGHWGIIIRRPLEAATRTLPLMAIAFLPIALFGRAGSMRRQQAKALSRHFKKTISPGTVFTLEPSFILSSGLR